MAKINLYCGKTYNITDYATPNRFAIILGSLTAVDVLNTMTEENLSEVRFLTESGAVTGVYKNKLLCSYIDNGDTLEVRISDADLVRYGLIIDENNRIISAVAQRYASADAIIVDKLPDGKYTDYLYVDGEFIYDPLPAPEQPEEDKPTPEERIAELEEKLRAAEILLGLEVD